MFFFSAKGAIWSQESVVAAATRIAVRAALTLSGDRTDSTAQTKSQCFACSVELSRFSLALASPIKVICRIAGERTSGRDFNRKHPPRERAGHRSLHCAHPFG